jgi:hypothetical protein
MLLILTLRQQEYLKILLLLELGVGETRTNGEEHFDLI